MQANNRNFTVELNEHDILTLMNLVKREINEAEDVWHPYWRQLLQKFQTGLENKFNYSNQHPPPINRP